MIRPITESFRFSHFIMSLITGDLSHEDAIRRARGDDGASIAWIMGHLCHYRYLAMSLLGVARESPFERLFGEAPANDGGGYPAIEELRMEWDRVHAELERVLETVTDAQLLHPVGGAGEKGVHGEKKVLDTLVFFMWHESYHMGQLGTIRKQFGYSATSDLVLAAAESAAAAEATGVGT